MEISVTAEPVPLDESLLEAAQAVLNQSTTHTTSPFALSEDHEFKVAEPKGPVETQIDRNADRGTVKAYVDEKLRSAVKTLHQAIVSDILATPLPGSPDSPYRKCPCLAVMPGRVCSRCRGAKWLKACPKCEGNGRLDMGKRKGADRSQPCGYCMATGQVGASRAEIERATEAARAVPAAPPVEAPAPAFRRAARLPGIGSPEKKPKGKRGRRPKNPKT
jgi:hypothetical protein